VVARVERLPVLLLVTYRPEFEVAWTDQLHVTFIALNRLGLSASAALVRRLAGENGGLPEDVVDEIAVRTDGVPLFIEELTKHVLETGIPGEQTNRPRSGTRGVPRIPATLHDSLMARLDRLAWAKELAQAASALGRHFPRALIAAITDDSPIRLQEGLDRLTEAQLVFGHGAGEAASYTFRHALVQDAAYGSMLRPRRRSLHRRIAEALETAFPEIAEAHPEAIGHHLTEAQLIDKAIPWWRRAGQKNAHASANVEAIVHFERCLGLLSALPEGSERDSTELDIRIDLSTALAGVSGYTSDEWKINSARLGELCDRVDVPNKLFPALWGQWVETFSAAEMGKATPMAERLLDVAQRHDNRVHLMVGHRVLGMSLVGLGQVAAARPHLEQAASLYDPRRDAELAYVYAVDQRLSALAYLCIALLQLGELPRATSLLGETITDAMALDQANTICFVLSLGACFHLLRRDFESLRGCSTQLERTAEKHSQTARALLARTINRLLAARTGGDIAVLGEITQGIVQLQAMNWGFWIPWLLLLDAEVRHTASSGREALALIERAECFIEPRSYGLCLPELYRLRAHFAASKGEPDEVIEAHYQRSIRIAGSQFALLPQLRSASELARYWRDRGKSREARAVLAGVLSRVGEGFDKKELMRARDVLTSLS
jgi:hypothetical protein